ncbi:hypothetical protein AAFF_G00210090 [Aldrovandia affinis]|uniref:Uncharacterized protein n=1 Tax=Aldrovandia affinis TaxID=143900 RepID=A0AAD7SX81_9TELE|nr:hypothetical protein AAFF_G00210090 [Aldrovandia affinis]
MRPKVWRPQGLSVIMKLSAVAMKLANFHALCLLQTREGRPRMTDWGKDSGNGSGIQQCGIAGMYKTTECHA